MPAKSAAQRELFAIAEHNPKSLFPKNKRILGSMSKDQMHDFASTKGLKPSVSNSDKDARLAKIKAIRVK